MHWGICLLTIVISAMVLFPKTDQNALVDFRASWAAARLLCKGENPYNADSLINIEKSAEPTQQKPVVAWNPPWVLTIMIAFAFLPYAYAKWVWLILNCLLAFILAGHWWRVYGGAREYTMASWLAALWFFPCIVALYFGQMSLIVLAGITGIACSLRNRSFKWLCIFVLLASLKPHLLLPMWLFLSLWMIEQRRWLTFVWASSGIAIAGMAAACLRPWVYSDYLVSAISAQGPVIWATPTIGTALRIAFPGIQSWVAFFPSICGMLLSFVLWRAWRKSFVWDRV